ncbi:MAG: guanylate kinase [Lachnospiraceae bacterium]|jgi:guanylate kinase|nr:guanylate kinase [Lachnospiraceae bacterium]
MNKRKGILIVVSGFSGAGKGTLLKSLVSKYENYQISISATTRSPREGEKEGREYFFVAKEKFEDMISKGEFMEYAQYVGNYYGTPKKYVEDRMKKGKDVILEIEIQGALQIKKNYPDALLLFVVPPSILELKNRLLNRGSETMELIESRLRRAKEEAMGIEEYDYIIVNEELDFSVEELHHVIEGAHHMTSRNMEWIREMREQLTEEVKGE